MTKRKALTIAGSDTSGGAGIQADLKTFQELGVYGMNALTVIVAQDPANAWHHAVFPIEAELVGKQIDTVLDGIGVDAMKTGMLPTVEIIETIASKIKASGVKNVVIDPVMVCKGADEVLNPDTAIALRDLLAPLATVITPNVFEAGQLSELGKTPTNLDEMKLAAARIHEKGAQYVLVKGGSKIEGTTAVDVLYDGNEFILIEDERIDTPYTHGAGCTYSSAITAELAKGASVEDAVRSAKKFITAAIRNSFKLNEYVGPTDHSAHRTVNS
ncbi:bifunctional hydroxymethylpyrimidine kinase/phosphomethylpyrimidine kinase [Exiguobacterium flavidum]|uniref:bifunctional hydroxymethylpyrimidine kinase/phosphomethylpyrimidine kinase n=1 Tax=Exiguobacterium flavidum TaxID=2184695 RepID=UPI000DF848B8|nr:bifunctional hydroxymethylpyrimidine kinase/phosphomethylpyrimidine kinase [Exiguobacterium flavidum]